MTLRRSLLYVALPILLAASVAAQQPVSEPDLPPEVHAVLDAAAAAPPEFQAHTLIHLAGSPAVPHPGMRKILLERAFAVGANAQEPLKRESAIAAGQTRAGISSRGFDLDLDALSLQSRAATALLTVDPRTARDFFAQLRPALQPLACGDALIYQVSGFYTRAAAVFSRAFADEERARGDDTRFLQPYVTDLTSPAQVAGVAELLRELELTDTELERLSMLFAWSLERASGDSRSFFQATGAPASVVRLVLHLRTKNIAPDRLIEGLRGYLVRNLSADRCRVSGANERYWTTQVDDFNASVRRLGRSEVVPITAADIASRRTEGEPASPAFWQTPEARARSEGMEALPLVERLSAINNWNGRSEENPADFFHQKATLFTRLLKAAPAASDRQQVIADYAAFLATYDLERESRSAWAVHLEDIVRTLRGWPQAEQAAAFGTLQQFGNSAMKLRAMVEALAPSESDRP